MTADRAMQLDPAYLEELYEQWKQDPSSLDGSWQLFFQGFDLASCPRTCIASDQSRDQSRLASLIYNYRDQGYRMADTNPLQPPPAALPDLALDNFGFDEEDLDRVFDTGHLGGPQRATLKEILQILHQTYCGHIGVEYLHVQDVHIRRWLQTQMEPVRNKLALDRERKLDILERLIDAELLETFINRHYLGQKRFSLEGSETLIPLVHTFIDLAPRLEVEEILIGMSHRGRLNVLANLLDKSYAAIFSEFEDNYLDGSAVGGSGDVKYHKGYCSEHASHLSGESVRLSLAANPSHLEAVDPVVLGQARARQRQLGAAKDRHRVLPVLIHGDAAFAGQGIIAETFNLSRLEGYRVGGTIHVVLNNQIGFTTSPGEARSTECVTDIAKAIGAPIFHVNGDYPEAAVHVAELALRFRQEFARDVVVELVAYRLHGHSEGDEPAFTQPRLYREIRAHTPVRTLYSRRLLESGDLSQEEEGKLASEFEARLDLALRQVRDATASGELDDVGDCVSDDSGPATDGTTAVQHEALLEVANALTTVPDGFNINAKIGRQLPKRLATVQDKSTVDWAMGEALAYGTILTEGIPIRLSGQDSERGTFSQRHAVWRDTETEERYVPLNHIRQNQARFCVYNSPLSEASVLGFDYGYSLSDPQMLVLWEAQFGDFANGAQVIIDQFISSAQAKWHKSSRLVMLLPHGFEGQGPEHSNAYLERYLAACAEDNIQVCNVSTPAQYFHLLRRQAKAEERRPLIIMTPKSLLRRQGVISPVDELVEGRLHEVLADPEPPVKTRRLVLCTGKIYYDLRDVRDETEKTDASLVRVEQLYPFPESQLADIVEGYGGLEEIVWVQEEPKNRGAWTFMEPRLRALFPDLEIGYVGRPASASPATGSLRRHRQQQAEVVALALDRGNEE